MKKFTPFAFIIFFNSFGLKQLFTNAYALLFIRNKRMRDGQIFSLNYLDLYMDY